MNVLNYESPFQLDSTTGMLRIRDFPTAVTPCMTLDQFRSSEFFPQVKPLGNPRRPGEPSRFSLKTKWIDQWAFMGFTFRAAHNHVTLGSLGFGWGALRNGFEEIDASEFRVQLVHFSAWRTSVIGPSEQPRGEHEVFYRNLVWGEVSAASDPKTKLVGISLNFH